MDTSISNSRNVWFASGFSFIKEIPAYYANSVGPDQTTHSVASDLGLHCLLMSLLWDARHKRVQYILKVVEVT